ncbi:hypothetical protein MMC34_001035 [Xylographa carneopallida]|nr:hypothetical protein [Xylographa carneopallida]
MTAPKAEAFATLKATIISTKALVAQFETLIQTGALPNVPIDSSSPNAIALYSDAGALLKAQTTKLSLIVLNKPFTPSEITFILKSLCQECIPALVSACQLCPPERYTNFLHRVIRASVGCVFKQYLDLLDDIPADERGIENMRSQQTLRNTGVIWEGMDFAIRLAPMGLVAVALNKMEGYHDLFKDAIEELEGWRDGDISTMDIIANDVPEMKPIWDGVKRGTNFDASKYDVNNIGEFDDNPLNLPRQASAAILPVTRRAIETLKLIRLLYPALLKRRVKRFPSLDAKTPANGFPTPEQARRYDTIISNCRLFSEEADNIAAALYALDVDQVESSLRTIKSHARKCVAVAERTWDDGEDDFTRWVRTWTVKLDEQ